MLKKIREFFSQKGQGIVEYALILGLAAAIAAGLVGGSGLQAELQQAIKNVKEVVTASRLSD